MIHQEEADVMMSLHSSVTCEQHELPDVVIGFGVQLTQQRIINQSELMENVVTDAVKFLQLARFMPEHMNEIWCVSVIPRFTSECIDMSVEDLQFDARELTSEEKQNYKWGTDLNNKPEVCKNVVTDNTRIIEFGMTSALVELPHPDCKVI